MSVGPEALRRFGPLLFLACPWGRAAVRARGAGLLCAPHGCSGLLRVPHGCSGCRRARPPARLGVLTAFGAASRGPPWPSGPSGTLHTSGVCPFCAYPIQAPPPPTSTTARPTNSSGTLHTGGTVVADVARRIASKPIQAPPPPTSTTARPTNSSGTIHTGGTVVADVARRVISKPIQAPPPPTSAAARPTNSSGAHHISGVLLGASSRSPSRPHRRPPAPQQALPFVPCSLHRWRWDFTELGAGCRRAGVLMIQNSRLVALKPRLEAVWRSKCRPPR